MNTIYFKDGEIVLENIGDMGLTYNTSYNYTVNKILVDDKEYFVYFTQYNNNVSIITKENGEWKV